MKAMAVTTFPADPTLDEVRAVMAPIVARNAAFDGWGRAAVEASLDMAASQFAIAPNVARLAFDGGAVAMIDAWFAHVDAEMLTRCTPERLASMKVRDRITALIEARLDVLARDKEALRRALSVLAMPQNLPRAARLGWRATDVIWRAAGDTAADFNHYTKRSLLGSIYSATLLVFLDDESEGHADTRAFLGRRIGDIMRVEKAKARLSGRAERRPSLARFVGRLRYHAR